LPHTVETVETVPTFSGSISTQLKQGVNERFLKLRSGVVKYPGQRGYFIASQRRFAV
jgi:hypothetical protein